jgi:hypothetical protein
MRRSLTSVAGLVVLAVLGMVSNAMAEVPAGAWGLTVLSRPTNLIPGSKYGEYPKFPDETDLFQIVATDVGAAGTDGTPVSVTFALPAGSGITLAAAPAVLTSGGIVTSESVLGTCASSGSTVTCTTYEGIRLSAGKSLLMKVPVDVAANANSPVAASATASGGGLPPASATDSTTISGTPAPFGLQDASVSILDEEGNPQTDAGSHPYSFTTSLAFNTRAADEGGLIPSGDIRDTSVALPPGLLANPTAVPECESSRLARVEEPEEDCPPSSQVGVAEIMMTPLGLGLPGNEAVPIDNLVPRAGEPAEIGFNASGLIVQLVPHVRGSDYGLTVSTTNASQAVRIFGITITLWGVPYAKTHSSMRAQCIEELTEAESEPKCGVLGAQRAFVTLPTACSSGETSFGLTMNSWQNPELQSSELPLQGPASLDGCNELPFAPVTTIAPDTTAADTAAGVTASITMPQEGLSNPTGRATADLRGASVSLPAGLDLNPAQAAGLQACTSAEDGVGSEGPPSCPAASRLGSVKVTTPLLAQPLEGSVYLMQSDPPDVEVLIAVAGEGVYLNFLGAVHANESSGELQATFEQAPQLPFSEFALTFFGGRRAPVSTPAACGVYTSTTDFTPWTAPLGAIAEGSDAFAIDSANGGGGCASLGFSPQMTAGGTAASAGAFSGFNVLIARGDGQQRLSHVSVTAPAGLSALLTGVPTCGEAAANAGSCPSQSQIGHAIVTAGVGQTPLTLPESGEPELPIYLTGPYEGAPFGLSIVTPVIAGPFNLGTIVTRAKIEVNPVTAQVTVATDPLPQIVKGVPTDLRSIEAVIDRPRFMFNPTNCQASAVTGTAWGTTPVGNPAEPGLTAGLSTPFGVGSCKELAFAPKVTVTAGGHSSRADGESLSFKIAYPKGAMGSQSWFKAAKFDIPKQLPSELKTIQQACLAATFEKNPAACPEHSRIGEAVVHTPVLPEPLKGPLYFVSYGSAKFPDVVMDLSGDNVNIRLTGETFISAKTHVTSATFPSTPDVPFESIEVKLPAGKYSEFGTNLPHESHDFCGRKLKLPTMLKAQNGLEIHQETPIDFTGCKASKHKAKVTRKSKGKRKKK